MKVRLNLPYMSEWPEYERFDGTVEIDGAIYNYVKRKIVNDTLYVLCIPDHTASNLSQQKIKYGIDAGDLPGTKGDTPTTQKKSFAIPEFTVTHCSYHLTNCSVKAEITTASSFVSRLTRGYTTIPAQPPRISIA